MRVADLVRALAEHLLDDEHHHRHDKRIARQDEDVQEPTRHTHVVVAHHVPHQHRPNHHVRHHPGQQQTPVRQCEDRGNHEPQRVLRAPYLVKQQEEADDEHDQFRNARGLRRTQAEDEDEQAAEQEQDQGDGVEDHRGALTGVEAGPPELAGEHRVDGGPLPAAVGVEAVELAPCVWVTQVHRRVDGDPGDGGGADHLEERHEVTLADRHSEVRAEDEQRPQFERGAQTDEHTGQPPLAVARREHRCDGEEDRGDVPVGKRVDDQQRRTGDEQRVPDAVAGKFRDHADGDHPDDGHQQCGDVEVPAGFRQEAISQEVGTARDPGAELLEQASEHRVFHVAGQVVFYPRVGVDKARLVQTACSVERDDVVVAGSDELAVAVPVELHDAVVVQFAASAARLL